MKVVGNSLVIMHPNITENIALPRSLIFCNSASMNKTQKETSIVLTVFHF